MYAPAVAAGLTAGASTILAALARHTVTPSHVVNALIAVACTVGVRQAPNADVPPAHAP